MIRYVLFPNEANVLHLPSTFWCMVGLWINQIEPKDKKKAFSVESKLVRNFLKFPSSFRAQTTRWLLHFGCRASPPRTAASPPRTLCSSGREAPQEASEPRLRTDLRLICQAAEVPPQERGGRDWSRECPGLPSLTDPTPSVLPTRRATSDLCCSPTPSTPRTKLSWRRMRDPTVWRKEEWWLANHQFHRDVSVWTDLPCPVKLQQQWRRSRSWRFSKVNFTRQDRSCPTSSATSQIWVSEVLCHPAMLGEERRSRTV